ncbi:hypothetical protein LJR225_005305 [Phenylobacterium sp. LjRoot225]
MGFLLMIIAAGMVITALLAATLGRVLVRFGAVVAGITCGLVVPSSVTVAALMLGRPDPRSIDGPAYVLVILLGLALVCLPICMAISFGIILERRRLEARRI